MKILAISNFYPPHYVGGYELGCRDVLEGLKSKGHQVRVLTSTYGVRQPESDGEVYRWLTAQFQWKDGRWSYGAKLFKMEVNNQRAFRRLCRDYKPDIVYVWNLGMLSVSLVLLAQSWGLRHCTYVSDNWMSHWECDSWHSFWFDRSRSWRVRVARFCLRPIISFLGVIPDGSLDLQHVQFASNYLRQVALQAGKPVEHAEVIPWGVDVNRFSFRKRDRDGPMRLLYVGQIVPHKGVDIAIEAFATVAHQRGSLCRDLTIVGGSQQPHYLHEMRRLVESKGLRDRVHFTGLIPRERLPQIYHQHDILLFPSTWDEPFSITLLEAMSCGLAVVSTATGGSPEVLEHNVNALVFSREDVEACAGQIKRLSNDEPLFERIRRNGRRTIENRFSLESMMNSIERSLLEAAQRNDPGVSGDR